MEITYEAAVILIRIINRYLDDHPDGESATQAREILAELKTIVKWANE